MNEDNRSYYNYTVKIKGKEKWSFGTTDDIDLKDITVEKELLKHKKD